MGEMIAVVVGITILLIVSWFTDRVKKYYDRDDYYDG
jgi:hypothetical protein